MEDRDNNSKKRTPEEATLVSENKRFRTELNVLKPPEPLIQLDLINQIKTKNEGYEFRFISKKWYVRWEAYCLGINSRPPPVNNSAIMNEKNKLKQGSEIEEDYLVIPLRAWNYLVLWHGLVDRSHELTFLKPNIAPPTKVKKLSSKPKFLVKKELLSDPIYHFNVYRVGQTTKRSQSFTISASCKAIEFQTSLLNTLDHSLGTQETFKLWLLNHENNHLLSRLRGSSSFVITTQFLNDKRFAIQIDTSSISDSSKLIDILPHSMNAKEFYLAVNLIKKKPPQEQAMPLSYKKTLGLIGLQNLGNTCYMNSALQCLSNTPQLTQWFTNNHYKQDLNTNNPLGLNGDLASAYAAILKDIWKENTNFTTASRSSISPREFKSTFERFNPHFVGFLQQDSQELLSFLLDGLHEDLNRVHDKPYIEIPDFDNQLSDLEIATRFWQYHTARNDSIIVDLFQGQYKSRLVCDECKKVSVTFDPFMYLSLPLAQQQDEKKREINIVYVPYLPSQKQLKTKVYLAQDATIEQLKQEVENNINLSSINYEYSLLVTEIVAERIYKVFDSTELVSSIQPTDHIYIYQLPCPSSSLDHPDWVIFPVYCSLQSSLRDDHTDKVSPIRQFGYPIVLAMKKGELQDGFDLYRVIVQHIERYCIVKLFEEDTLSPTIAPSKNALSVDLPQQPIHTTAAVTSAGGRPTTPVPNLFQIKVFECQTSSPGLFPQTSQATDWKKPAFQEDLVQQGQGVIIEWTLPKAQQAFGSSFSSIKTDAWHDFDETKTKNEITLQDCLDEFTSDERLTSEDSWYCPQCKKHQHASKKMDIWKLPEIMVVHLKRFSQFRRWGETKLNTFVDFPLTELDMTDKVLGPHEHRLVYDLYAVDNHYGGIGGGHYTAFAQNFLDKEWYEFNDTQVTRIESNEIKTNAAYLLFYKRRA
ncbi:uncharacterized protein B0P05DRAFT_582735 [Gilbertella persicaria]|uniref:uncharacterized protein n=1 Tax=Gilbertella persicaria TaxID=101096 RepID=UPI0022200961|nr:uncharacterized protein B0P05DRAFT_582735 [Gilbertella persicaria]KAI8098402.1 hypothetical protein B0P05DRAFT_582735 [Gilbertella persicaria]